MPLSEHEQRELEQIERYLAAEDPKFVSSIRNITPKVKYKRRIVVGCVGFVLGIALLFAGVANAVALSIAGFGVMFLSLAWIVRNAMQMRGNAPSEADPEQAEASSSGENVISIQEQPKRNRKQGKAPKPPKSQAPKNRGGGSFIDRIEARWLRRRDRPWY